MKLILGNMKYSSWSLRPWLLMSQKAIAFDLEVWDLFDDEGLTVLAKRYKTPEKVPLLIDDAEQVIWESTAIIEVLSERFPDREIWPNDPAQRALARSAAAEIHAGFLSLRQQCPMKCDLIESIVMTDALQCDLDRLAELWRLFETHSADDGFIFGAFGAVDAMFAPVAIRTRGYQLHVSARYKAWENAIFAMPEIRDWFITANMEERVNPNYYVGEAIGGYEIFTDIEAG